MSAKARAWPIDQQADWELRDLRTKLETTLATLPDKSPDHTVYTGRLNDVVTEQEVRRVNRNAPRDDE
jgi:hypothetical protein